MVSNRYIYLQGTDAFRSGIEREENPYDKETQADLYRSWDHGWVDFAIETMFA